MKVKNKHGRIGVKTPLSHTQRQQAYSKGRRAGYDHATDDLMGLIAGAKSLRELKKGLGIA